MGMRSLLKHIFILFVPAAGITYYLYTYKPRHYRLPELIGNLVVNITLWMLLLLPVYLVLYATVQFYTRLKQQREQVKQ